MPISENPENKEKQLANLRQLPAWLIKESQEKQGLLTKSAILEASKKYYPNLSKIAREIGVSRSLITYHIDNDKELLEQMEENFARHLDEIEENVLTTAKKEQYAGIGIGVLNKLHKRYKEEKQQIQANIQVNIGGLANPYQQSEIDSNDSTVE